MEQWEKIEGFEYLISNQGRVKSIRNDIIMKTYLSNGYPKVDLYDNLKRKKDYVHRLMAIAFISNLENKPCINHKDGKKMNNNINNIEWCTYSENSQHSYDELGRKVSQQKKGWRSVHAKEIDQFTLDGHIVKRWGSITEAQRIYGSGVEKCLGGKVKSCHGFLWKYRESVILKNQHLLPDVFWKTLQKYKNKKVKIE